MTAARGEEEPGDPLPQPGLALGFLACAPLFLLYELGLEWGGEAFGRNSAELSLTYALSFAGPWADSLRRSILAALLAWSLVVVAREEDPLPRALSRVVAEGLVAALVLGPLLVVLLSFFDARGFVWDLPAGPALVRPRMEFVARLVGAAAWEECLFRWAGYSIVFLLVLRLLEFLGLPRQGGRWVAELSALLGSSVLFAAFHLQPLQRWLGHGGEAFDPGVFLWRLLAGLLLAGLFRWRGLGVAAWAHGLFNLGLALGAGPGVFQSG